MDTLLPRWLAVPDGPIDTANALFAEWAEGLLVLEIGFGGGEHLATQAAAQPNHRFIGVEPFLNGVASCLRHIEESGVRTCASIMGDARDVLARLPSASLDRIYILFPRSVAEDAPSQAAADPSRVSSLTSRAC